MKIVWPLICLFALSNLYAFEATQCPRTLKVTMAVTKLPELNSQAYKLTPEQFASLQSTQDKFSWEPTLDMNYHLSFAGAGKCYYEGRDFTAEGYQARVEETSEGLTIQMYSEEKAVKLALQSISPSGPVIDSAKVELQYRLKQCVGKRCRSKFFTIGEGVVDEIY